MQRWPEFRPKTTIVARSTHRLRPSGGRWSESWMPKRKLPWERIPPHPTQAPRSRPSRTINWLCKAFSLGNIVTIGDNRLINCIDVLQMSTGQRRGLAATRVEGQNPIVPLRTAGRWKSAHRLADHTQLQSQGQGWVVHRNPLQIFGEHSQQPRRRKIPQNPFVQSYILRSSAWRWGRLRFSDRCWIRGANDRRWAFSDLYLRFAGSSARVAGRLEIIGKDLPGTGSEYRRFVAVASAKVWIAIGLLSHEPGRSEKRAETSHGGSGECPAIEDQGDARKGGTSYAEHVQVLAHTNSFSRRCVFAGIYKKPH